MLPFIFDKHPISTILSSMFNVASLKSLKFHVSELYSRTLNSSVSLTFAFVSDRFLVLSKLGSTFV